MGKNFFTSLFKKDGRLSKKQLNKLKILLFFENAQPQKIVIEKGFNRKVLKQHYL